MQGNLISLSLLPSLSLSPSPPPLSCLPFINQAASCVHFHISHSRLLLADKLLRSHCGQEWCQMMSSLSLQGCEGPRRSGGPVQHALGQRLCWDWIWERWCPSVVKYLNGKKGNIFQTTGKMVMSRRMNVDAFIFIFLISAMGCLIPSQETWRPSQPMATMWNIP